MKGPKPYHEATPQEATRNGLLPGQWRETKYPGDAAVNLDVVRDGEMGMIRIQVYGPESYMVASYTPGYQTSFPGDTPKFNPDQVTWCEHKRDADRQFAVYVIGAFRAGWKAEKSK